MAAITKRERTKRLEYSRYFERSSRFDLCCFFMTVYWSLLKQQDLDTIIIIKVSIFDTLETKRRLGLSYLWENIGQ